MKMFLIVIVFLFGCRYEKEIQVERAVVEIVHMEPLYRQGIEAGCRVTCVDLKTGINYTIYANAPEYCDNFLLGVKYKILLRK